MDGSAYDDRLHTPLDHLARKIRPSFAYPSRVVNTIRALVEKGRCQPLLPLTSNAVSSYRGPEEGFAWLFASEYAGVDLEERDAEGWTLLGDAAFNFGWWTQVGADDPAVGWQSLYLLRAGANPHKTSAEGGLTPLDTFLRGCTRHQVENANSWLRVLLQSGVDLHKYADEELSVHGYDQYMRSTWDEELQKWTQIVYRYGNTPEELQILVEDFDALSWFHCGRFDLEIFQFCAPDECSRRWKEINTRNVLLTLGESESLLQSKPTILQDFQARVNSILSARWFQLLCISFVLNYYLHLMLVKE